MATDPPKKPLRVAIVLETSGGGSGRHVLDLARGLLQAGCAVEVFWSPLRAERSFVAALDALAGARNHPVAMRRAVGFRDIGSLLALRSALRRCGPFDVIHGHSSKAGALVRLLPRAISGARIYTPHAFRTMDPDMRGVARRVFGGIETLLSRFGARIIAVSEAEAHHARALGIPERRIRLVVNGSAAERRASRAEARATLGLAEDDVAVGFIGRLVEQKDPLRFVEAVRRAQTVEPRLVGVVMGEGPLRPEAELLAAGARIVFTGWVDSALAMPGLDLFCMTSRYEAMPYTLLEAIHAGLPIIATEVGGVKETVSPGHSGAVVPVDAPPEQIAAELAVLCADRSRLAAWSEGAHRIAAERTVERMVRETLDVYREAVRDPRA